MANRMVVMYAGNCVEQGGTDDIIQSPLHPYTVLLLSSTPEPFREEKLEIHASEDLPDLAGDMKQCPFASRCPRATDRCRKEKPENYVIGDRQVKCFLYEHAKEGDGPLVDVSIYR